MELGPHRRQMAVHFRTFTLRHCLPFLTFFSLAQGNNCGEINILENTYLLYLDVERWSRERRATEARESIHDTACKLSVLADAIDVTAYSFSDNRFCPGARRSPSSAIYRNPVNVTRPESRPQCHIFTPFLAWLHRSHRSCPSSCVRLPAYHRYRNIAAEHVCCRIVNPPDWGFAGIERDPLDVLPSGCETGKRFQRVMRRNIIVHGRL